MIFKVPIRIKKNNEIISYTIFKLAFLLFFGTPGMSEDMALCAAPTPPPDKYLAAAAPSVINWAGTSLPTCLEHILHKPKKFQTKVFSFIYLHKFKMIFTASSKFWPRVKKMHLNFGTCPHRQVADPNSNRGRYPRSAASFPDTYFLTSKCLLANWPKSQARQRCHYEQRCSVGE